MILIGSHSSSWI
ncbi:hypothetical protein PFNF54_02885 [Plasmodium falciparum NF54]|uniref:Uncharacterized protein n=1 Tax=Plasmodium falciparum (isolate NF54) TaxID=5843 RepID=W7K4K8_PLAFO|nr:hypothetical protein PFNF54_02885 [Plasmodium falciparum NF54]